MNPFQGKTQCECLYRLMGISKPNDNYKNLPRWTRLRAKREGRSLEAYKDALPSGEHKDYICNIITVAIESILIRQKEREYRATGHCELVHNCDLLQETITDIKAHMNKNNDGIDNGKDKEEREQGVKTVLNDMIEKICNEFEAEREAKLAEQVVSSSKALTYEPGSPVIEDRPASDQSELMVIEVDIKPMIEPEVIQIDSSDSDSDNDAPRKSPKPSSSRCYNEEQLQLVARPYMPLVEVEARRVQQAQADRYAQRPISNLKQRVREVTKIQKRPMGYRFRVVWAAPPGCLNGHPISQESLETIVGLDNGVRAVKDFMLWKERNQPKSHRSLISNVPGLHAVVNRISNDN